MCVCDKKNQNVKYLLSILIKYQLSDYHRHAHRTLTIILLYVGQSVNYSIGPGLYTQSSQLGSLREGGLAPIQVRENHE